MCSSDLSGGKTRRRLGSCEGRALDQVLGSLRASPPDPGWQLFPPRRRRSRSSNEVAKRPVAVFGDDLNVPILLRVLDLSRVTRGGTVSNHLPPFAFLPPFRASLVRDLERACVAGECQNTLNPAVLGSETLQGGSFRAVSMKSRLQSAVLVFFSTFSPELPILCYTAASQPQYRFEFGGPVTLNGRF